MTGPHTIRASRPSRWPLALVGTLLAGSVLVTGADAQADKSSPATTPVTTTPQALVSESGKSLVIPDDVKSKGVAYHVQPGGLRQVSFRSDAPFEKISGHSNGIIGFAIAGPDTNPAQLQAGQWQLPISSLKTSNAQRDGEIAKPEWLDATKFPIVSFRLKSVSDVQLLPGAPDATLRAYSATLVGAMTIHGVTADVTLANTTIRFRPKNHTGGALAGGDLLLISCKHTIQLSTFGVKHPQIADKKVSDTIEIDLQLLLSTIPPEQQPPRAPRQPEPKSTNPPPIRVPQNLRP
jgi:polyisoprenoid-binding protein YceI